MKWLTTLLLVIAAVLAGLLVYRRVSPAPLAGGTALVTPLQVPKLELVNDQGQATTLAASDGRLRLVFFGFVQCPDVCPTTLASLQNTYRALTPEQQRKIMVQFITVDPANDTPALVREYLNRFNPAFTGLTGKPGTIDEAAKALYVANIKPTSQSSSDTGTSTSDHSHHGAAAPSNASAPNAAVSDGAEANVSAPTAARIHGDEVRVITPAGQFVRVYLNQEALDGTLKRDLPELIRQYGS